MEKIYFKYLFIISTFLIFSFSLNSYIVDQNKLDLKPEKIAEKNYYKEIIDNIKILEGFSSSWYSCSAGKKTIGYGTTKGKYKEVDNLIFIDSATAENYLRLEFNKCLSIAAADGLSKNKALAIASFIYNVGEGNYKRSTLRKLILKNKPIDNEIIKWVYAKGKFLRGLNKRRKYELKIFKDE